MGLDNSWIFGLTKDFQKVIVTDEIESGENGSLLFQEIIQGFLTVIQLC